MKYIYNLFMQYDPSVYSSSQFYKLQILEICFVFF